MDAYESKCGTPHSTDKLNNADSEKITIVAGVRFSQKSDNSKFQIHLIRRLPLVRWCYSAFFRNNFSLLSYACFSPSLSKYSLIFFQKVFQFRCSGTQGERGTPDALDFLVFRIENVGLIPHYSTQDFISRKSLRLLEILLTVTNKATVG